MEVKDLMLFHNLSEEEREQSLACSQSRVEHYKRNEYIYQQEDEPDRLYFVLEGNIELGQINSLGRLNSVEYVGPGKGFGQIEVFLEKKEHSFYAKAETQVTLLAVSKHFFYSTCSKKCAHHSKIVFNMLRIFAEEAEKNSQKLNLLSSGTLCQRIAVYLLQLGKGKEKVKLPMKREELAAYLNTTRPSLSRELSRMQEEQIIEIMDRNHIRILDEKYLESVMELGS